MQIVHTKNLRRYPACRKKYKYQFSSIMVFILFTVKIKEAQLFKKENNY